MAISVRLETTRHTRLRHVGDPHGSWETFFPAPDDTSTFCLRFVDPYGDLLLNRLQIPVFIAEWDAVACKAQTVAEKKLWQEIKNIAVESASKPYYQLMFIGD